MNIRRNILCPHRARSHERGVGALLAMMFLVIFASLAAAMAIVSQGNLATADTQLKIDRSLAAAETGLQFIEYHLNQVAVGVTIRRGVIDSSNASDVWQQVANGLIARLSGKPENIAEPSLNGSVVHIGPIAVAPGGPEFIITLAPHPLTGENYDADYYKRPPYDGSQPGTGITQAITGKNPLGPEWIRITVQASDGPAIDRVYRSISVDFKMDKKIPYALLSKSRVMIGRNVMVDGPIGSTFTNTQDVNGHPIQMESDFRGLTTGLNKQLDQLEGTLITNDVNGDNRIDLNNTTETAGISNPSGYDINGDGYIDGYDFFLGAFDNGAEAVTVTSMTSKGVSDIRAKELMRLIDTAGDASRAGYGDGVIDDKDDYAKIRGQVYLTASKKSWNDGAGKGAYQDYYQGPIQPNYGSDPTNFEASQNDQYQFDADDFDTSSFGSMATGTLPAAPDSTTTEAVPFGAAHPYDYYTRPVYQGRTFTNLTIPAGTNALFKNCTFIGVTFVQTAVDNADPNYNYAGMQEIDGTYKHPDFTATVDGKTVSNTKTVSNNIRFDSCTFEGSVVTDSPQQFTQVRNKLQFTGATQFQIEGSTHLSDTEKALFSRSTLLAPNFSVEMGSFIAPDPSDTSQTVELTGTIVAGLIDMRGQVNVDGTILTTFDPQDNTGPVIGNTSPQFNTTLGYFGLDQGDFEAELPTGGLGVIHVHYNPRLALPDGILGPIRVKPVMATYFEGGKTS